MAVNRMERVNALLRRVIGEGVFTVFRNDSVDPGLITVIDVNCAKDLKNATVKVSVFGDKDLQTIALHHLIHHARDFRQLINREVRLKCIPELRFELDHSLEKGDRVLALLNEIGASESADQENSKDGES
ncbi:MAG: 30S ribosome-binding factor RbfA [Kiritimatiellae bacterium]|nr:30S ribosome-binding factor RbfA [Kiritimatiellia bacterium]